MSRVRCEWHCAHALREASAAANYERMAEAAEQRGDAKAAEQFRTVARVAADEATALSEQMPHGYRGAYTVRYEPAEPGAPGRKMVVRLGRAPYEEAR